MDKTSLSQSTLDSLSLSTDSSEEIVGQCLFPSLEQMANLTMQAERERQDVSRPDLIARTLLDAAEKTLLREGGKLHIKDLRDKMVDYGLIPKSAKSLANLESIIYKETFCDNSKFKRIEGHMGWFALSGLDVDDMESSKSSSEDDQSESMEIVNTPPKMKSKKGGSYTDYKKKYYGLRKAVKELVFLNAAIGDDIVRTEAKLIKAKTERKFLLKRLFQYQAATEAGVLQPHGLISYEHSALPLPDLLPTAAAPKNIKNKVKKKPIKTKEEKGSMSKTKSALHKKLTQAKLSAQAKNMAKLQYQRTPKTLTKSPSQSKLIEKEQGIEELQQPKLPTQSVEVVQTSSTKDKKPEKSKPARPKVKKTKPSESPQASSTAAAAAAAAAAAKLDEAGKPKRKKPGTAIKRKVQPIPVDGKGKPIFPIILGGLTVHSLGEIVSDRPGFHSERYIWPVGYCSSRTYPSIKDPDKKCIYTCKILDGGFGPQFEMCPEDDPDNPINASSATACHCVVLKALNKARGRDASNTGSGPEFFGYSHPTIQYLIQNLPGAKKCSKYQWVKFELPKPQSKQGGKLSSACKINLDGQLSPSHDTSHNLSSSSSQDDVGSSHHDNSSLTLHSSAITDDDDLFEDIDISTSLRPLALESSTNALSGQLGTTNDIDTGNDPMMSSPSLSIPLSPPPLTSPSATVTGNGSFMMPLTSPLFGSATGFPSTDLPDLTKH